MKLKRVLLVYKKQDLHRTFEKVKSVLRSRNISYEARERSRITRKSLAGKDLAIVVGGDGTFLRTSHFIKETPIFGVNSHPHSSEGFFMQSMASNFAQHLDRIATGRTKLKKLLRLEVMIGNRKLPYPALNEVFVGAKKPFQTSRYTLKIKGTCEKQMSSGIIVATPAGTRAWMASASGPSLPLSSKRFAYHVRDPFRGKLYKPKLLSGILGPRDSVKITMTRHSGIVAIDSASPGFVVKKGVNVTIKLSQNPLIKLEP